MKIDGSPRGDNWRNQASESDSGNQCSGSNSPLKIVPVELQMLRSVRKLTGDMNARSAAEVLATYMRENGNRLPKLNRNQLEQLSVDERVPPHVRQAAQYMLDHPDEFKRIQAHNGLPVDGFASVGDFESASQGAPGSIGGQMNTDNEGTRSANGPRRDHGANTHEMPIVDHTRPAATNEPQEANDMNGAKAAGIVSAHMQKNKMDVLNWNGVYLLAVNADGNTPPGVQQAAKYLLAHRQETVKMATLDPDSPEGYITATALNKAAQSDESAGGSPSAASESGVLAAHMREKGISSLNMDQLIKLSTDKDASPRARQAAKYMLDHPDEFRRIQTHSGTTSNDSASARVDDFEWANQGGLGSGGEQSKAGNVNAPRGRLGSGVNTQLTPNASNMSIQPSYAPPKVDDMNGPKAAGIMAAYMRKNKIDTLNWTQASNLMNNTSGNVPPEVQQAAKYMCEHREEASRMATLDPDSPEGYITATAFNKAAQADEPAGGSPSAASESGVLAAHMREKGISSLTMDQLVKLSTDKEASPRTRQAAKYMLDHPEEFNRIEARDGAAHDGSAGVDDFEHTSQYGMTNAPA